MSTATTQASKPPSGFFERTADFLSFAIGTPWAFVLALIIVLVWALLGPASAFSDTWQLIINTGLTILTFWMVFLLANASNRITEGQERTLSRIYSEEQQVAAEERLIEKLLERMDVEHIKPILNHLDEQDHQLEAMAQRVLDAVQKHDHGPAPDVIR